MVVVVVLVVVKRVEEAEVEYGMDIALKAGRRNCAGYKQSKEGICICVEYYIAGYVRDR